MRTLNPHRSHCCNSGSAPNTLSTKSAPSPSLRWFSVDTHQHRNTSECQSGDGFKHSEINWFPVLFFLKDFNLIISALNDSPALLFPTIPLLTQRTCSETTTRRETWSPEPTCTQLRSRTILWPTPTATCWLTSRAFSRCWSASISPQWQVGFLCCT